MNFLIFSLLITGIVGCEFKYNTDQSYNAPLILKEEGIQGFKYSDPETDVITFSANERFWIACPGSYIIETTDENSVIDCKSDGSFSRFDKDLKSGQIKCKEIPSSTVTITKIKCSKSGVIGMVEFTVQAKGYPTQKYLLYKFCINEKNNQTIWSQSTIVANTNKYPRSEKKTVTFRDGNLYKIPMDQIYTKISEFHRFKTVLDSVSLAAKLIQKNSYLAKGHLVARTDFIYPQQKFATYSYLNVAPMWQSINAGHWFRIESTVRVYAALKNRNLEVITGGLSVYSTKDGNDNFVNVYLYGDGKRLSVPIPGQLFKVVYDPIDEAGIVFLTINDPNQGPDVTEICTNICGNEKDWISSIDRKQLSKGYTYCCEVNDFRAEFNDFPSFKTTKILNIFQ